MLFQHIHSSVFFIHIDVSRRNYHANIKEHVVFGHFEQSLEWQIAQRDLITSGTTLAVQSLDQKNTAGIGDLRGRVARYPHQAWVQQYTV